MRYGAKGMWQQVKAEKRGFTGLKKPTLFRKRVTSILLIQETTQKGIMILIL